MTAAESITLTTAINAYDQRTHGGRERPGPWDEFANALLAHDRRPEKERSDDPERVLGFTLARFAPGPCTCGKAPDDERAGCPDFGNTGEPRGHRINENVIEVTALGIDLDKNADGSNLSRADLDRYLSHLESLGLESVYYSSHSYDGALKCSGRAIVRFSRPVPVARWKAFAPAALQAVGLPAGCGTDARRFWYLPSAQDGAPVLARRYRGKPLDVDAILAPIPEPVTDSASATADWAESICRLTEAHRAALAAELATLEQGKGQSATFNAIRLVQHDWGLGVADAWPLLVAWNKRHNERELRRQVERVSEKPHSGPRGWKVAEGWNPFRAGEPVSSEPVRAGEPVSSGECRPIAKLASDILAISRPARRVYSTGFAELDDLIAGGLRSRSLTVTAARTGAGKSGLVLGIGLHAMREHEIPFLYASTELEDDESAARMAGQVIGCSLSDIMSGRVTQAQVREALARLPFYVIDCHDMKRGRQGLALIESEVKRISDKHGVAPLTTVDYLQMLVDEDPRAVRMGVSEIANQLRGLAQRADCPLVAVSSTGRAFYKPPKEDADDPLSYLGAAKESGDVEFAAANLLFLDVDREHDRGTYAARLVVAKSRWGTRGFVGARFEGPSGRWTPHAPAAEAMSTQARARRDRDQKELETLTKVYQMVQEKGPVAWSVLRPLCGTGTAADKAKAQLLLNGKIEEVEETYFDTLHRSQRRKVLRAAGKVETAVVPRPLPPIDPTSPAARFLPAGMR